MLNGVIILNELADIISKQNKKYTFKKPVDIFGESSQMQFCGNKISNSNSFCPWGLWRMYKAKELDLS